MNSPSPLIPQGSNLEQQNQARSSLKVKIFCAIGVNVVVLLVLLMQGCKREQPAVETPTVDQAAVYDASNQPPVYDGSNQPPVIDAATSNQPPAVVDHGPVTPPPATTTLPPATGSEYKIEKGDSFYTIGKKFGVTVKALQAANPNIDPAKLQIGKTIQIPAATAAVTPPAVGGTPVVDAASGETTITVKSGDTLGKIATEHHTTVKAIQAANGLKDTRIKVGEKLKIPAK